MATLLQRKLKRFMATSSTIAEDTKLNPGDVEKVLESVMKQDEKNQRKPAPTCPKGGISQSKGSRKYHIPQRTISRWTEKGYIPVLLRTGREVYIGESKLAELAKQYNEDPGQGKRTINPDN